MINWAAYDPRTGVCIEELPGLKLTSSVSQIIGRGDQVTASLPITDRLPDRWELATAPGRVAIAGVIDTGSDLLADSPVLWGGFVARRGFSDGAEIVLQIQPPEQWLARNYVPKSTYTQVLDTTIMRALGLDAAAAQFHGTVTVDSVGAKRRDRSYTDDQDKTRLSAMQDLMRVIDGPEFALTWKLDSLGCLCLDARTAPMLGRRSTLYVPPTTVVSRANWEIIDDYGDGKGATVFTGVATREGDSRVTVVRSADTLINAGYLRMERRWQPDTGATETSTIASYVDAAKSAQQMGTRTLAVSVHLDDVMPGRDFDLGDDIAIDIENPDLGFAISATKRLLGWVADPDPISGEITEITPIFAGDEEG